MVFVISVISACPALKPLVCSRLISLRCFRRFRDFRRFLKSGKSNGGFSEGGFFK